MTNLVDLHLHTIYSDGSYSPEELVDLCRVSGFSHIALTDHDTYTGVPAAIEYSGKTGGPKIIPACEMSCHFRGDEVHILGYHISFDNTLFNALLEKLRAYNEVRIRKILEIVNSSGYSIKFSDVKPFATGGICLAPQLISALFNSGQLSNSTEGFEFLKKYLLEDSPDFVYHENHPEEILSSCKAAKVITSLAHPHKLKNFNSIFELIDMGIDGIEYYYPNVPGDRKKVLDDLVREKNLIRTGGSDFHGIYKTTKIGDGQVPFSVIEGLNALRERKNQQ
jgi:predicted metal-dependent phosphoesterase TrpH